VGRFISNDHFIDAYFNNNRKPHGLLRLMYCNGFFEEYQYENGVLDGKSI